MCNMHYAKYHEGNLKNHCQNHFPQYWCTLRYFKKLNLFIEIDLHDFTCSLDIHFNIKIIYTIVNLFSWLNVVETMSVFFNGGSSLHKLLFQSVRMDDKTDSSLMAPISRLITLLINRLQDLYRIVQDCTGFYMISHL